MIFSVLTGLLIVLVLFWLVVLKNELWKAWLHTQHDGVLSALARELGLSRKNTWKPRLVLEGRQGPVRLSVQWRIGVFTPNVAVTVRQRFKRRRWVGPADASADELTGRVRDMMEGLKF